MWDKMKANDSFIAIHSFLSTVRDDHVCHPLVEPFLQLVGHLGKGDAVVEVGQHLSQTALSIGLLAADCFGLSNPLAAGISTEKDLQFP